MADEWPKITGRRTTAVSPWMQIVAREVEFSAGAAPQVYHAIDQPDYIAIVALTPQGWIPIVRQYRPAVESFTWELPAGMLDQGETAEACCVRELKEETGFSARAVHALGSYAPCTARLSNQLHSFFVETDERGQPSDTDIEMRLVTPTELAGLIVSGEFVLQLHIGALLLAGLRGFIDLGTLRTAK
jgi:8-oxo-dGTP pyrophosphatase MutT (NUDIX family)